MKPSSYYDRVVDVMEELMKFTLLTRDIADSERGESALELSARVNLPAAADIADKQQRACGCAPTCCSARNKTSKRVFCTTT